MEKQRKTFLSYSRANKDFAIRLAKELKAEGFEIWLDQLDIPAGSRWDREVERALKESEIFMIILTPASVDSENVLDEIGYAIDNGKRFLPVLLEKCDVPLRLRRFQYVDFTNKSFDDGVESAKDLLRGLVAQPTIPRMPLSEEYQNQIAKAEADLQAKEEAERIAIQKAEAERKAKDEAEQLAVQKAEEERLAKEKADRLAAQKAEAERIARQKAEEEERVTKEEADRQASEEADRLAAQKAEQKRLEQERAEQERLALAKADREAKAEAERKVTEEADRLARQKSEEDRLAKEETERNKKEKVQPVQAIPTETNGEPIGVLAPAQKKLASRAMMYGIAVVVVLAILGIGFSALSNRGTLGTVPPVSASATKTSPPNTPRPSITPEPSNTSRPTPIPEPIILTRSEAEKIYSSGDWKGIFATANEQYTEEEIVNFLENSHAIPVTLNNPGAIVVGYTDVWCATTREILEDNLSLVRVVFKIENKTATESNFVDEYYTDSEGWECMARRIVIYPWPRGEYNVYQEITLTKKVNDGEADHEPFTDRQFYIVTVP